VLVLHAAVLKELCAVEGLTALVSLKLWGWY